MKCHVLILLLIPATLLLGCSEHSLPTTQSPVITETSAPYQPGDNIPALDYMKHNETYNAESVIPPQCYTKTDGVNNPCYACHQTDTTDQHRPNQMADGNLQGAYEFSDLGAKNHWKNLFIDRTHLISGISDDVILDWINQDNYSEFIKTQQANTDWKGEITPIENLAYPEKAFNALGIAKDGSGWVAFNYKPFPSTFWPTNGSTGDVMIRLPSEYRQQQGVYNQDVYVANLSLVELTLKGLKNISTPPLNEKRIGIDLNQDGKYTTIQNIKVRSHYVGDAQSPLAYQLYPEGTEFLHTVRYIGVNDNGTIFNAPRMKEVRYMKKHNFKSKQELATSYYREAKEKAFENLPQTLYLGDAGINNSFGWTINGYIEDGQGKLRPQHKQELAFCNGCHKTVGATYDQTFSFARKVTGAAGWGYIDLKSMTDVPNKGESQGEFLTYMQRVGGGDEFRQNQEMLMRWFTKDGQVDIKKVTSATNLYELITPSPTRALALNKAYLSIVKEQSYLFGRDATLGKARNVLEYIDDSQQPLKPNHRYVWDMQLAWAKQ
ncbi:hypothetical protein [Pseudoalteromonas sp. MMG012]|uniref:hypothetical protein n=1 Tax=Pseudoalteromonas sp. MMG012 TaxID=2822686 RepID=UPI001B39E3F4|nr:hypothetical protein [Pseudoalteromonas sp. MMG012]MBQ4850368.1 hypothetical protein [Pseudoalteromonas sp. MMG012]